MSKLTNFAENKLIDFIRGQTLTLPASWHFGLCSAADDTGATEVTGTGYARVALARSLTNYSGTQGAGTTAASSGQSHETRNNVALTWPAAGAGGGPLQPSWLYSTPAPGVTAGSTWTCHRPLPWPPRLPTHLPFRRCCSSWA